MKLKSVAKNGIEICSKILELGRKSITQIKPIKLVLPVLLATLVSRPKFGPDIRVTSKSITLVLLVLFVLPIFFLVPLKFFPNGRQFWQGFIGVDIPFVLRRAFPS